MDTLRYYIMPLTTLTGVVGFLLGGQWVWLGAATYVILMAGDLALPTDLKTREHNAPWWVADLALYLQAPLLVAMYAAFLSWFASDFSMGTPYAALQILGSLLSLGWLGGVPTLPIAHELWHRRHWFPRLNARFIGTFYLDPAKDVGHNLGHHILIATSKDADTAQRGQTVYGFVWQARKASWRDTFAASSESLRRRGKSIWNWRNVSYQQVLMPIALAGVCFWVGGIVAAAICVGAMIIGNSLMEGLNYYQHYGLIRAEGEEIAPPHAWSHLGAVVRPVGCEITNHVSHHLDSYTRFDELETRPDAPQMPSLFICFLSGLIPPLWMRAIAQPRLRHWDHTFATPAELELARAANKRAGWPDWFSDRDQTLETSRPAPLGNA